MKSLEAFGYMLTSLQVEAQVRGSWRSSCFAACCIVASELVKCAERRCLRPVQKDAASSSPAVLLRFQLDLCSQARQKADPPHGRWRMCTMRMCSVLGCPHCCLTRPAEAPQQAKVLLARKGTGGRLCMNYKYCEPL